MNRERLQSIAMFVAVAALAFLVFMRREPDSPLLDKPAPDFTLPIVAGPDGPSGDRLRLSDFKGQVVVLDFWASWCGPCKASVPMLSRVAERYADRGVRFIGINSERLAGPAYPVLYRSWGFGYPLVQDADNRSLVAYDVHVFPSVFVIDRTQTVRAAYAGEPTEAMLRRDISKVLE